MAMQYVPCSEDTRQVCTSALGDMFGCTGLHDEFSLPAFVIGLEQCSEEGCQETMIERAGFKYLALDSGGKSTLCDVDELPDALETGCVAMGAQADLVMEMVKQLDRYPGAEQGQYEVRWLSVPGILVEGFWLKSGSEEKPCLVIPVAPLAEELQAKPVFDLPEFVCIIQTLAAERMRHSDL